MSLCSIGSIAYPPPNVTAPIFAKAKNNFIISKPYDTELYGYPQNKKAAIQYAIENNIPVNDMMFDENGIKEILQQIIEDFETDDVLYVVQMMEPIIMNGDNVVKTGTVILGRIVK